MTESQSPPCYAPWQAVADLLGAKSAKRAYHRLRRVEKRWPGIRVRRRYGVGVSLTDLARLLKVESAFATVPALADVSKVEREAQRLALLATERNERRASVATAPRG